MREGRLRLSIASPEPVEVELDRSTAAPPGARVTELSPSASQRRAGIRRFEVLVDGWRFEVEGEDAARAALRARATRGAGEGRARPREAIRARIPGRVVRVWVAPGDTVEAGARLLAVEAMKMENEIRAPHAGTVESVPVAAGQAVEVGAELVVIG